MQFSPTTIVEKDLCLSSSSDDEEYTSWDVKITSQQPVTFKIPKKPAYTAKTVYNKSGSHSKNSEIEKSFNILFKLVNKQLLKEKTKALKLRTQSESNRFSPHKLSQNLQNLPNLNETHIQTKFQCNKCKKSYTRKHRLNLHQQKCEKHF